MTTPHPVLSKPQATRRSIAMLLAALVLLLCGSEIIASVGLARVSRIHQRIMTERREAESIRRGQVPSVLFVGNSLFERVDMDALKTGLSGRFRAQRFIVEATTYYDWFFGLRRLFRKGMQPDQVVVCLHPTHLISGAVRGDFSAGFLFDLQDLWPMSRSVGADLTTTSGYYVAHFSRFYAARSELRSVLMGRIAPNVPYMWQRLNFSPPVLPDVAELPNRIEIRLREMKELCERNGSQLIVLIPPTMVSPDQDVVLAGQRAGVRILRPIPSGSLPLSEYEADRYHLNTAGARLFTAAIVKDFMTKQ